MASLGCITRKSLQFSDSELNQGVALIASAHVPIDTAKRVVCPSMLNVRRGLVWPIIDKPFERSKRLK
jgi:hypothetical protein